MADFLSTLFGGGAQEEAAAKNAAALQQYQGTANDALTSTYNTGTGALNSAIGAYTPLANLGAQYSGAGGMLMNSLGLNGPQGNAIAQGTFSNDPGTQGAINAGLDVLNRRRAAQGMNNSGNADIDALTYGTNLQNQQYQNWQTQLAGLNTLGVNATGNAAAGQAGGYTGLANLAQTYGSNQAGVANNVASGTMADNNMVAAGQAAGAKNLLGAGLSLATLAAGGAGIGGLATTLGAGLTGVGASGMGSALGNWGVGGMPATGAGAPSDFMSNMYARSQGIPT